MHHTLIKATNVYSYNGFQDIEPQDVDFSEQKKQALTTLSGLIMPYHYPDFVLINEGLGIIKQLGNNNVPGLVSDSDGSLIRDISNPVIEKAVLVTKAVSYKSSPSGEDMSKLYCQIACFLQYTADPCKPPNGLILEIDKYDSFVRVWHVDILPDVVREAHKVFLTYFCHDEGVKEIKKVIPQAIKELREKLREICSTTTEHLGDFPLLTFSQGEILPCRRNCNYVFTPKTLIDRQGTKGTFLIEAIKQSREDGFAYTLLKAANIMIYTLADIARAKSNNTYYSVYWFPAASDLSVEVDKTITEHVLTELRRRNLNVVACSFDGKSHLRVSTGMKGEPQTYMQVVRNHWDECKKVKTVQDLIDVTAEETGEVKRLSLLCLLRIHRLR
ncbi:uncharacterized protein LOC134819365 [Bolinopsis microptera]|uniref:uncharacterized protein LOC134819365 n=1 Tax=Bolinopsis microptera TaxID=2820187 RepID=UPI00307A0A4B